MNECSEVCAGVFLSHFFAESDLICLAFRDKMRHDTLAGRSQTDTKLYEQNVTLAREVADVLRKNIVQAQKIAEPSTVDGQETWSKFDSYHSKDNTDVLCRTPSNKRH